MSTGRGALTRGTLRRRSCYDAFMHDQLAFTELCGNCRNYLNIPYKKKQQSEMGKRDYHCTKPGQVSVIVGIPYATPVAKKKRPLANSNNSSLQEAPTPPPVPKKRRATEVNVDLQAIVDGLEMSNNKLRCELDVEHSKNATLTEKLCEEKFEAACVLEELESTKEELVVVMKKHTVVMEENALMKSEVLELEDENARMREENEALLQSHVSANESVVRVRRLYNNALARERGLVSRDPLVAAGALMVELAAQDVTDDEIIEGFFGALMSQKYKKKTIAFMLSQELHLKSLFDRIGKKRYDELQEKFKPWVCLRELDFVATVSFRGYEIIRRIEFSEEEDDKYMRGLFRSRQELSRLSRKLEQHAEQFLPYQLTSNSVSFEVRPAVKFILERFGLWRCVEEEDIVTVAATVDGGDLAWKLTQVSGGIKICDEKAVNPLTGEKLFGECGTKLVQSRYACFPLQVHIAKDNGTFYDEHLSAFFHDLQAFEDEHPNGLQFTHGADMSSLQKTLKRGTPTFFYK